FQVNGGPPALVGGAVDEGSSQRPRAPSADALVNNSLVIRVLAATGPQVEAEAANMAGHLPIALRRSLLFDPILGMTYRHCPAGSTGSAEFNLPSSARYVTATLVFAP